VSLTNLQVVIGVVPSSLEIDDLAVSCEVRVSQIRKVHVLAELVPASPDHREGYANACVLMVTGRSAVEIVGVVAIVVIVNALVLVVRVVRVGVAGRRAEVADHLGGQAVALDALGRLREVRPKSASLASLFLIALPSQIVPPTSVVRVADCEREAW
jgi:hypothetical protein